jgi:hypothetical protein
VKNQTYFIFSWRFTLLKKAKRLTPRYSYPEVLRLRRENRADRLIRAHCTALTCQGKGGKIAAQLGLR